ncbi:MAG: hypothetical protein ACLUNQ_02295 [Oscillospiraceae bacterium]
MPTTTSCVGMDGADLPGICTVYAAATRMGKISLLLDHTAARPGNVADPWYTTVTSGAAWLDVLAELPRPAGRVLL